MVPESFVFALCPTHEEVIQRAKRAPKRRGMKTPIVPNPTGKHRLNPLGDFRQGAVIAMMQPPAAYPLMHRFGRFVAHGRSETHEELPLAVPRRARAKGITQEVEALLGVAATPVSILAVNDPRLVRMKGKATLREALRQRVLY